MPLAEALGWKRGTLAYAEAPCWEVEGYVPARRLADIFHGSVLGDAWPALPG